LKPTKSKFGKPKDPKATLKRLLGYLRAYKLRMCVVLACLLLSSIATVGSSLFIAALIDDYIAPMIQQDVPLFAPLIKALVAMGCLYLSGILATLLYNLIMVRVSQGILRQIRDDMFNHMQVLISQMEDILSYIIFFTIFILFQRYYVLY